jgi:hypothetical protein
MSEVPIVFADAMMEANVLHGVVRITLAKAGPDNKPQPTAQLVMPLVQVAGFVGGLTNLLRQVEARIKDAKAAQAPAAEPAPVPSAFTFGDHR